MGPTTRMFLKCVIFAWFAANLLIADAVPAPDAYFGHKIGADRTVLDWDRVVGYFRTLEKASKQLSWSVRLPCCLLYLSFVSPPELKKEILTSVNSNLFLIKFAK